MTCASSSARTPRRGRALRSPVSTRPASWPTSRSRPARRSPATSRRGRSAAAGPTAGVLAVLLPVAPGADAPVARSCSLPAATGGWPRPERRVTVVVYDAGHPFPPLGTASRARGDHRRRVSRSAETIIDPCGPRRGRCRQRPTRTAPRGRPRSGSWSLSALDSLAVAIARAPTPDVAPGPRSTRPQLPASGHGDVTCGPLPRGRRAGHGAGGPRLGRHHEGVSISATLPRRPDVPRAAGTQWLGVTFALRDGSAREQDVGCAAHRPPVQPRLHRPPRGSRRSSRPVRHGAAAITDVPCGRNPGRSARVGLRDARAHDRSGRRREGEVPLEIASRDYPIAATGHLEIDVGRGQRCPTGSCPTPGSRWPIATRAPSRSRAGDQARGPLARPVAPARSTTSTSTAGTRARRRSRSTWCSTSRR